MSELMRMLNDDTTQILLAIVLGIIICWFIFGRNGGCGLGGNNGFSVGGQPDYTIDGTVYTVDSLDTIPTDATTGIRTPCIQDSQGQNVILKMIDDYCCGGEGRGSPTYCPDGVPLTCDENCSKVVTFVNNQCENAWDSDEYDRVKNTLDVCNTPASESPPVPSVDAGAGTSVDAGAGTSVNTNASCNSESFNDMIDKLEGNDLSMTGCESDSGELTACSGACQDKIIDFFGQCNNDFDQLVIPEDEEGEAGGFRTAWEQFANVCGIDVAEDPPAPAGGGNLPLGPAAGGNCPHDSLDDLLQEQYLQDACGWDETNGQFQSCNTGCQDLVDNYSTVCEDVINESRSFVRGAWSSLQDKCEGPAVDPAVESAPVEIDGSDIEEVRRQMLDPIYANMMANGISLFSSSTSVLQNAGVNTVVLRVGSFDPKVVFGGGESDMSTITGIGLRIDGVDTPKEQRFGSIADAVASLRVSQGEGISDTDKEVRRFCGEFGTYGDDRIDPDAKVIDKETYSYIFAHESGCLAGITQNASETGIESYPLQLRDRFNDISDEPFGSAYVDAITASYDGEYPFGVARITNHEHLINVSGIDGSNLDISFVLTYRSGVPDITGLGALGSTLDTQKELLVSDIGLTDQETGTSIPRDALGALERLRNLQYLVFLAATRNTDVYPTSVFDELTWEGSCNLGEEGGEVCGYVPEAQESAAQEVVQEDANVPCQLSDPTNRVFAYTTVTLNTTGVSGFIDVTREQLAEMELEFNTDGELVDYTRGNKYIPVEGGQFIFFLHSDGLQYVTISPGPEGIQESEREKINAILSTSVCGFNDPTGSTDPTGWNNPQCCLQLMGEVDNFRDTDPDKFLACEVTLEASVGISPGGVQPPAPTPPTPGPPPTPRPPGSGPGPAGGGGGGTGVLRTCIQDMGISCDASPTGENRYFVTGEERV